MEDTKSADRYDIEFQLSPIQFHIVRIETHKAGMTFDQRICKLVEEKLDQFMTESAKY